jgi:hypothetical protein
MDPQARIQAFSLAAHRLAVARLRERPERLVEAIEVIQRWRGQAGGPAHCEPYWLEWDRMLHEGVDAVERVACATTDHATTLRSVSPLGRFISVAERNQLLREARDAA